MMRSLITALCLATLVVACGPAKPPTPDTATAVAPPPTLESVIYRSGMTYLAARPVIRLAEKTPLLKAKVHADIAAGDAAILAAYDVAIVSAAAGNPDAALTASDSIAKATEKIVDAINNAEQQVQSEGAALKIDKTSAYTQVAMGVILSGIQAGAIYREAHDRLAAPAPIGPDDLAALSTRLHVPL